MKDNQTNNGRDKISNLIIFIDNFIQEILIYIKKISFYFLYNFSKKYFFLKKNENLKNKFANEKIFILGLAPSINNYSLFNENQKILNFYRNKLSMIFLSDTIYENVNKSSIYKFLT